MNIPINQINVQSNTEFCSVLMTNEDKSNVFILSRYFGALDNYIEWNDQSNSTYGGMKAAVLDGNVFTIHFNETGKDYFGIPAIHLDVSLAKNDFDMFLDCVREIFADHFSMKKKPFIFSDKPVLAYEKIKYLNLSSKRLKSPPDDLRYYTNLEKLFILDNSDLDTEAVFAVLQNLPMLKKLHITINGKIPCTISSIVSLEELHIEGTPDMTTLPVDIGNLSKLYYVYLQSKNEIILPEQFSDLSSLAWLHVRTHSWSLPKNFYKLSNLKSLDLYNCDIIELPDEMYRMENLESIAFGYNEQRNYDDMLQILGKVKPLRTLEINITSSINNLGNCTQIEHLIINSDYSLENEITFDDTFCHLQRLKTLHFNQCNITKLPDCLFELTELRELSFTDCQFTSMPPEIVNLRSLETLIISNCENLAFLPSGLGRLTSLKSLQLYELPMLKSLPSGLETMAIPEDIQIPDFPEIDNIPESWLEKIR